MYKNLLVPLDGSKLAEAALPVANYLAQRFGAAVTLLHLIEHNAPAQIHGEPHLKETSQATAYLQDIAQRSFAPGIVTNYHVHASEISDVARSIIAHAEEFANDLVVMCVHGRGGIQGWMFGSIPQQVVAAGTTPVLLVQAKESTPPLAEFRVEQILVPLDVSGQRGQGILPAVEVARACGAAIDLVMVVPTPQTLTAAEASLGRLLPLTTSAILELSESQALDTLKTETERIRQQNITVNGSRYRGSPASVIVEVARQKHTDLIVLATHGRTGLDAFFEESLAAKISSLSRIPLLLVRISDT